ncbi:MAG: ABC transporter substrate-binding protein [Hydrogenibacillus schlegelii]|uniref:ABC transporter substrate-binding protein n=1 Tax=Hydrogenibacillus schlegelii TaxID=1484 RepID=A0A947D271_HYDSH|nr:ABC transporter substrate-binding protein [Hydrogenibacillus schlegelii]
MRRKLALLRALVMVGFAMLAGCGSGDAGKPEALGNTQAERTGAGAELRLATTWPYPFHGNPFGPGGVGGAWWLIYEPFAHYIPATEQYVPRLAKEWSVEGQAVRVTLRDGVKLSDGTPFTSDDVVSTVTMIQALWSWPYEIEAVEAPDSLTVVFHLRSDVDPNAFLYTLLTNAAIPALAPKALYDRFLPQAEEVARLGKEIFAQESAGETVDAAKKSAYEDKLKALKKAIDAYQPFKDAGNVPSVGAYLPKRVTQTDFVLERNPHHWEAGTSTVSRIVFRNWSSNEFVWGALVANELDAAHPLMPKDVVEGMAAQNPALRVMSVSDLSDVALLFNFRKPLFQDDALRKAIAFVLDRDKVRDISAWQARSYEGEPATGILASAAGRYLPESEKDKLTPYRHDPAQAENLLREAGYQKDGSRWKTPQGAPVRFTVSVYGPHNDWVLAAREVVEELKRFGFDVDLKLIPEGMRDQVILGGDFEAAIDFGSAWWGFPHPATGFDRLYRGDVAKATGFPADEPSPLLAGASPSKLAAELLKNPTGDDAPEKIVALARLTHEALPVVPLYEKVLPIYYNTSRFAGWPEDHDPLWTLAPGGIERVYVVLAMSGQLQPKTK